MITKFQVAYKNLLRKKVRSLLTLVGIALSSWVLVSLLGFNQGYEASLNKDIDNMGFQIMIMAKGCPYEAATLMLQGGTGLRYMKESIMAEIEKEPEVEKITPILMSAVFDPNKGERGGIAGYFGIDAKSFAELKPFLKFKQGGWFTDPNAYEDGHGLRSGRTGAAGGGRHDPDAREERPAQGRRHPGADGHPGRRDDLRPPQDAPEGARAPPRTSPPSASN